MFRTIMALSRGIFYRVSTQYPARKAWPLGFLVPAGAGLLVYLTRTPHHPETVDEEANRYVPIQSDSERAAGHPIVGSI